MKVAIRAGVLLAGILVPAWAAAETVDVVHRGPVSLAPFACDSHETSLIGRICYDARTRDLLARVKERWYQYCDVPAELVEEWRAAPSRGRFFNARIRGRGEHGPFDCRGREEPGR